MKLVSIMPDVIYYYILLPSIKNPLKLICTTNIKFHPPSHKFFFLKFGLNLFDFRVMPVTIALA